MTDHQHPTVTVADMVMRIASTTHVRLPRTPQEVRHVAFGLPGWSDGCAHCGAGEDLADGTWEDVLALLPAERSRWIELWDEAELSKRRGLMSISAVAEYTGLSRRTIQDYRLDGRLPEPAIVIGRSPGWTREQIEEWMRTRPGQGARTDLRQE